MRGEAKAEIALPDEWPIIFTCGCGSFYGLRLFASEVELAFICPNCEAIHHLSLKVAAVITVKSLREILVSEELGNTGVSDGRGLGQDSGEGDPA